MRKSLLIAGALALTSIAPVATIAAPAAIAQEAGALPSGDFVRKQKRLSGGWSVEQRGEQTVDHLIALHKASGERRGEKTFIVFADDFRAARGPDLKVFLSPQTVADVTGDTAVDGSVLLGELSATRGAQEYVLPEGVSLSDFNSVLVHCEAYAVLWGGGDL